MKKNVFENGLALSKEFGKYETLKSFDYRYGYKVSKSGTVYKLDKIGKIIETGISFKLKEMDMEFIDYLKQNGVLLESKMGRPTTTPKTDTLKMRLSAEDNEKLEYCMDKLGKRYKSEILRIGLEKLYNELKVSN